MVGTLEVLTEPATESASRILIVLGNSSMFIRAKILSAFRQSLVFNPINCFSLVAFIINF